MLIFNPPSPQLAHTGQNILLFDSGRKAKLAGFGTSVHIGDATFSTKIMRNSPPEVVNREKPDFSADVWGVMCVFVDMLTAKKYQLYNNRLALVCLVLRI